MPGSLPLWTTLLALWWLHEKVAVVRWLGLACIVFGDLLVGGMSLLRAFEGGEVWKGDLLFMTAACCWATYTVTVRKYGIDPIRATMAITALAFVVFVPLLCWPPLLAGGPRASRRHPGTSCSSSWRCREGVRW